MGETDFWYRHLHDDNHILLYSTRHEIGELVTISAADASREGYSLTFQGNGCYRLSHEAGHYDVMWTYREAFLPGEMTVSQDLIHAVLVRKYLFSLDEQAITFIREGDVVASYSAKSLGCEPGTTPLYPDLWWGSKLLMESEEEALLVVSLVEGRKLELDLHTGSAITVEEQQPHESAPFPSLAVGVAVAVVAAAALIVVARKLSRRVIRRSA